MVKLQFYTYLHCRPDGTPFYVGKGADRPSLKHGIDRRSHSKKSRNQHHKNITSKYGWESIQIFVFPCDSEAQAFADEMQQIAQLRKEGYVLCNATDGGEGCSGMVVTAETRIKISAALQGRKQSPRSAEWRAKLSAANKGKVPPPHVLLAAVAVNKKQKGVKRPSDLFSDTWREKQAAAKKGVPWSEARRAAHNKRKLDE